MTPSNNPVQIRTSLSHPLRIDELCAGDAGGSIGITFCPGKCGEAVRGWRWERDLAADLDVIEAWHPAAVVTLIEQHEFEMLGVPHLGERIRARGIRWYHLPIVDVRPPDARFEAGWLTAGAELTALLKSGRRVVVHCRGGLGRAGTVAARLLVELGVPAREAVERVRKARRGAIETDAQLEYVLNL
jgi:protein-tyrosine phosphatase